MDARDMLLELIDEGVLDRQAVIEAFVRWCTNDEIVEMCHANELPLFDEEEVDEGEDAYPWDVVLDAWANHDKEATTLQISGQRVDTFGMKSGVEEDEYAMWTFV